MRRFSLIRRSYKNTRLIITVFVFVLLGLLALFYTHAAPPSAGFEAESGSVVNPASQCSVSGASGGQCIQFGPAAGGVIKAIAIGDMACGNGCSGINAKTSALINNAIDTGAQYVLMAGDIAYSYGSGDNYKLTGCQHPTVEGTWGNGDSGFATYFSPLLAKAHVFPAVGNHEYYTVSQTVTYDPTTHAITSYSHNGTDASCKFWPSTGSKLCDKYGNNCINNYKADPLWPYFHVFHQQFLNAGLTESDISARKTYYSFNIGNWHVVSLNSSCSTETYKKNPYPEIDPTLLKVTDGCGSSSAQVTWLKTDLATSKAAGKCSLAYYHRPYVGEVFSAPAGAALVSPDPLESVSTDYPWEVSEQTGVAPSLGPMVEHTQQAHDKDFIWQALYDNNVDVVVNGHAHNYFHYHNVKRDGTGVDATTTVGGRNVNKGIEELVPGTGGPGLTPLTGPLPSPSFLTAYTDKWGPGHGGTDERGVLQLEFYNNHVHYKYLSVNTAPGHFTDEGDVYCH